MHDKTAIEMMSRCKMEIEQRDRRLKELQPKAEAYERLCQVLDLHCPQRLMGADRDADIIYTLRSEIEKAADRMASEKPTATEPEPCDTREIVRAALGEHFASKPKDRRQTTAAVDMSGAGAEADFSRD